MTVAAAGKSCTMSPSVNGIVLFEIWHRPNRWVAVVFQFRRARTMPLPKFVLFVGALVSPVDGKLGKELSRK